MASTIAQKYATHLFQNGPLNLDASQIKKMLSDGFAVSKVLPFRLTPELIPPPRFSLT